MTYTLVAYLHAKPDCIDKVKEKMIEASQVYSKDKGTLSWLVMQDETDPQKFRIIERYENKKDQETYHLDNPYWKTFDPYIRPLLTQDIELGRYNELDTTSKVVHVVNDESLWDAVKKYQSSL